MAESIQPLAGAANHKPANRSMLDGGYSPSASASGVVIGRQKPKLGGSIAAGVLIGAVAAFLVGGLVGVHETTTGVVRVGQSSVVQPAAP